MKNKLIFSLIALFVLSTTLVSCNKDDDGEDNFTVDKQSITLVHDGTEAIIASASATWTSDNEFVASVDDNGVIIGNHVGETTITATSGGKSQIVKVTVKPMYNTIIEPIVDFTLTKSEIKTRESRSLYKEENNSLTYAEDSKKQMVTYDFDENTGKLNRAMWGTVGLGVYNVTDLSEFLIERYNVVDRKEDYYYMINSDKLATATLVVTLALVKSKNTIMVMYVPYENKN